MNDVIADKTQNRLVIHWNIISCMICGNNWAQIIYQRL